MNIYPISNIIQRDLSSTPLSMVKIKTKRKIKEPVNKKKRQMKLLLVDHDGTLCDTNPLAYDSIRYAFETTLSVLKIPYVEKVDIEKVMADLRGSTEKNLARYLCYMCAVPFDKTGPFEEKFYLFRAKWYESMKSGHEYVWDTYYPDTHQLLHDCMKSGVFKLWIITGNPKIVLQERLANSLKDMFSNGNGIQGVFGDEFYSRQESILEALKRAEKKYGKRISKRDNNGFYENVYYIGDSRNDFFAGIEAKVKTIWVPSRTLQIATETKSTDYVRFITKTLKGEILITNDLYSKEVREFVGLL